MPTETRLRLMAAIGLLASVLALLATPATTRAGTTERVSVDSAGNEWHGVSNNMPDPYWVSGSRPAISADGRFVAFSSSAAHLVPGDPNGDYHRVGYDRRSRRAAEHCREAARHAG